MRFVFLLIFLGACTTAPGRIAKQPDTMCVDDCLGTGGTHEFCQARCSD